MSHAVSPSQITPLSLVESLLCSASVSPPNVQTKVGDMHDFIQIVCTGNAQARRAGHTDSTMPSMHHLSPWPADRAVCLGFWNPLV